MTIFEANFGVSSVQICVPMGTRRCIYGASMMHDR